MPDIQLKGGFTAKDSRLGRVPHFDDKSRNFPITATLSSNQQTPRSFTWGCDLWLDQGQEGACTGFSVTHEAAARPVVVPNLTNDTANEVYHRAKQLDEWPGEDYDGSSVLGAIKAGRERGWYGEFRWAFGLDDLVLAIGHKGPVVLGINWYEGQFDPDAHGFIHVSGQLMGGHAILCRGVSVKGRYFRLHNSWGKQWGMNGDCFISYSDMDRLLHEQGEACIPVQRYKPSSSSPK